jgi:hypothetical protein
MNCNHSLYFTLFFEEGQKNRVVGEVLCEIGEVCTKSNVEKVAR